MRMNKEDIKKTLVEKKDTMEELARSQAMEVKTIDNMRFSLLAIEVYERFNFVVTYCNNYLFIVTCNICDHK
jgi:hypothetical protein